MKKIDIAMTFYYEWIEELSKLDKAEAFDMICDLIEYSKTGTRKNYADRALDFLFSMMAKQIDRDKGKYQEKCMRNSANASKRWNEKKSNANACDRIVSHKSHAKHAYKDEDKDKEEDEDEEEFINTYAHQDALSSEKDLKDEFERLWELYPRKRSKNKAMRSYINARKRKKDPVTYEQVKNGIEAYNMYIQNMNMDTQYIKHGSTWFHQECWNDDYTNDNMPKEQISTKRSSNGWY